MAVDSFVEEPCVKLERLIRLNPTLHPLLNGWHAVALPDCWLVAGAIAQTVWNDAFGLSPHHGLSDIDLVYFDPTDLSEEAEAQHAKRVRTLFREIPVRIDVKNEARVHVWYAAKFGHPIAPYVSTAQAIGTFPTTATAIGVHPTVSALKVAAPF